MSSSLQQQLLLDEKFEHLNVNSTASLLNSCSVNGNTTSGQSLISHDVNNLLNIKSLSNSSKSLSSTGSTSSGSTSSASSSASTSSSKLLNNFQQQQLQKSTNMFSPNTVSVAMANGTQTLTDECLPPSSCSLCKNRFNQPKLLSCLHVFCKACLLNQMVHTSSDLYVVVCPKCRQETLTNSLDNLDDDYVMLNMLDMISIEEMILECTSCKTEEKAVARCSDCAEFLCPNCVSAHQFMRCFENHAVVRFEDIKALHKHNLTKQQQLQAKESSNGMMHMIDCGVPIHKPLFCKLHKKENLKYFCNTCQIPICTECIVSLHAQPMHTYERIGDVDKKNLDELNEYVQMAKESVVLSANEFQTLDQYLNELQEQMESSKMFIEETFQSYKVMLEKRRNELFRELDDMHTKKEHLIMNVHESIELCMRNLRDTIRFTERIVRNGNATEILLLKHKIVNQINATINKQPHLQNTDICLKFQTDPKRFEKALFDNFGQLYKQEPTWLMSNIAKLQEHQQQQQMQAISLISPAGIQHQQHQQQTQEILNDPDWLMKQNIEELKQQWLLNNNQNNNANNMSNLNSLLNAKFLNGVRAQSPMDSNALHNMLMSTQSRSQTPGSHLAIPSLAVHMNLNGKEVSSCTPSGMSSSYGLGPVNHLGSSACSSVGSNASSNLIAHPHHLQQQQQQAPNVALLGANTAEDLFAANMNQLSKLMQPMHMSELNTLNNLNELAIGANLLNGAYSTASDANSNSSQSPPTLGTNAAIGTIGSGLNAAIASLQSTFSGNGNLNPPVRQNGKMSNMQIRTKFGTLGSGKSQFNSPHGFCLGVDEEIIVADTNNHRIQVFDKNGEYKYAFGSPGREEGQLWYPRKVTVMRETGKFVVCDRGNERSRMQIFSKNGHFLKKISIRYIDIVAGLAITQNGEIVAVDSVSPTVFRISEDGALLKWFDCSDHMREPSDIAISGNEYFVCDFKGHCVAVFNDEGTFLRRIGGENITNFPNGIDVSDAGDVLVGDSHGNRFHVAVFARDGTMISEFECPYVKVSRCCGLKITSEGFVVTLAKNNHHVLVLNTLYVS